MPMKAIIGTLGYVRRGDEVLLVHRQRDGDDHKGKYNGLGGKLEPGEDAVACIIREIREEAGIVVTSLTLRGTIAWPGFGSDGSDWFGLVFVIDEFDGEVPDRNDDGPLSWVPIAELDSLPMWEGDRHFLPLVFDDDPRQFHAVMPYRDGVLEADRVVITRLGGALRTRCVDSRASTRSLEPDCAQECAYLHLGPHPSANQRNSGTGQGSGRCVLTPPRTRLEVPEQGDADD